MLPYKRNSSLIHLIKIDNWISRPTDFQQKCRLSVGLLFPKWIPTRRSGDIILLRLMYFCQIFWTYMKGSGDRLLIILLTPHFSWPLQALKRGHIGNRWSQTWGSSKTEANQCPDRFWGYIFVFSCGTVTCPCTSWHTDSDLTRQNPLASLPYGPSTLWKREETARKRGKRNLESTFSCYKINNIPE